MQSLRAPTRVPVAANDHSNRAEQRLRAVRGVFRRQVWACRPDRWEATLRGSAKATLTKARAGPQSIAQDRMAWQVQSAAAKSQLLSPDCQSETETEACGHAVPWQTQSYPRFLGERPTRPRPPH